MKIPEISKKDGRTSKSYPDSPYTCKLPSILESNKCDSEDEFDPFWQCFGYFVTCISNRHYVYHPFGKQH